MREWWDVRIWMEDDAEWFSVGLRESAADACTLAKDAQDAGYTARVDDPGEDTRWARNPARNRRKKWRSMARPGRRS